MLKASEFVPCGEVIKTHGSKGAIKTSFSAHFLPAYKKGDWLFIEFNKKPVPFFIEAIEYPGDDLPVFKLEDIDTPEAAQELLNRNILFPKREFPEEEETHPVIILGDRKSVV